ncbi:cytochrome P450 [Agromyces sp. NPDC049794]|uniref:cytochrome P450 n=1 Tax=unclassified Agromyces TaxID=2639701 RepID=UPI0033CBF0FF
MKTIDEIPAVIGDLTDDADLRSNRERHWAGRSSRGIEVFSYDPGMQVLEHPDLLKGPSFQYRLDQLGIQGEARRYMDMVIPNKEGDERRQMRASMAALFRPTQISKMRQSIRAIVHNVLDEVESPSAWDLMELCWQIPARTYCDLVSIPHDRADTVIRIADSLLGTLLKVNVSRREEAEAAILESVGIVREHLDARRQNLGDDFTSVMIRQQQDGLMTEEQLVAQSFGLLQASVDNTAHQMGNVFGMLLTEPDRWGEFVANQSLRGPIIEEGIRLYPRFGTIFRIAAKDVAIDDVIIPEGTWAFVSTRAGQRDPEVFGAPDEYRLNRPPARPLMFGAGPYNCMGQNLARMEIEEAMTVVAERFPDLVLTGDWGRKQADAVSETTELIVDLGAPAPPRQSSGPVHVAVTLPKGEVVIDCEVVGMHRVGVDSLALDLQAHDASALPDWTPGSHIDVVLPNSLVRQYSLCGERDDRSTYRVAILREEHGAGGSAYIHDQLRVGDRLEVRGPRNNFTLEDATSYRFIAGGIGITAILPMVREAERRGAEWNLVYVGRDRRRMAFLEEVSALPGERVRVIESRVEGRPEIGEIVGEPREGTLLYACGPASLLADIAGAAWSEDAMRFERFEPDLSALAAPSEAFSVRLTQSAQTIRVPAEKSILDVMEESGVLWPYSCREGTCGSCETRIVAGRADHRDAILTPAERRANETMMVCVSRALSDELELEA